MSGAQIIVGESCFKNPDLHTLMKLAITVVGIEKEWCSVDCKKIVFPLVLLLCSVIG